MLYVYDKVVDGRVLIRDTEDGVIEEYSLEEIAHFPLKIRRAIVGYKNGGIEDALTATAIERTQVLAAGKSLLGEEFQMQDFILQFFNSYEGVVAVLTKYVGTDKDVVVPFGVYNICDNAFANSDIRSVAFPSSVKYIGTCAFENCTNLERVHFNNNLKAISRSAFAGCTALKSVDLTGMSSLGCIDVCAFKKCTSLAELKVESKNCYVILDDAFIDCNKLRSVELSGGLDKLSKTAFARCAGLQRVDLSESKLYELQDSTFSSCKHLVEVKLPASLREIGARAFFRCESLRSVQFTPVQSSLGIGAYAFASTKLRGIALPVGVKYIDRGAFYRCSSLTSVLLQESLLEIGEYAFGSCKNLKKLRLPESVDTLGDKFFGFVVNGLNIEYEIGKSKLLRINTYRQPADLTPGCAPQFFCSQRRANTSQTEKAPAKNSVTPSKVYFRSIEGVKLYLHSANGTVGTDYAVANNILYEVID